MDDPHRYDDMLDMPHHVSPTRPRMSRRIPRGGTPRRIRNR